LICIEHIDCRQTESVDQTTLASLQFEFASLQVFPRRHKQHIASCVFAEKSNQLRVNEATVDRDLILDKLDEGLPDL